MVIGLKKGDWVNRTDFPILEKLKFDVQAGAECNVLEFPLGGEMIGLVQRTMWHP